MKILALEFASERRSVAVIADAAVRGAAEEFGQRSARAFGLIECALQQANLEQEQIDCIAVGLGPGSYTGIRAAIAVAQGWQVARGIRTLGLSTVECMAAQAQAAKIFGLVHTVIDAQRDEFYLATHAISKELLELVVPLRLASMAEVASATATGKILIWPELNERLPQGNVLLPDAAILGQLAACGANSVSAETLEPIYLREARFVKAPTPRKLASRLIL